MSGHPVDDAASAKSVISGSSSADVGAGSISGASEEQGSWYGSIPPIADEDELVGTTLSNTYQVVGILGEGGMGRVYEAQHTRIASKRFALKVLHPELSRRKDVLVRFQREVEAAASIDSAHVVTVFDIDQTPDGRPFLVSELLEGKELGDYLRECGQLGIEKSVPIVRQICVALQRAHEKGVIHRDMKPENVFLVGDVATAPLVKVLDFGISRLDGQEGSNLTRTGMVMGTPAYMAPEQARGERVDVRADVYSVGAILYQCVTGQPPFQRADATATLAAVLTEEPTRPRALAPGLPEPFEFVIQRAMAALPDERYATMDELDAALAPFHEAGLTSVVEKSARFPLPRAAQVSIAEMGGMADARAQLVILVGVLVTVLAFSLVTGVGAAVRLMRSRPTAPLSGLEALVVGLVLLAALSTPVFLVARHIARTVWPNTARVMEVVGRLRTTLAAGLGTWGMLALLLRSWQTVMLRRPLGVASPLWDLLFPMLALGAGLAVYFAGPTSARPGVVERLGVRTTMLAGIALALVAIVGGSALGVAGSGGMRAKPVAGAPVSVVFDDPPSDDGDQGDADGAAIGDASATGVDGLAARSAAAFQAWDRVRFLLKAKNYKAATIALEKFVVLDPKATQEANVRLAVANLLVGSCVGAGSTCDRAFRLVTSKLGPAGASVLFDLVTTRGGTVASRRAESLLRDKGLRATGTPDFRVAYDLRSVKNCDAAKRLFARARREGGALTIRILNIMKSRRSCRSLKCCLSRDRDLEKTLAAIEAAGG